ncbi:MAG: NAD(P)H-hydrate dehydratase [Methylotenera sp.]|nr:NAD(P)H-hydrate dehydratase [Methylotenera sp.]MSP99102.1 NAD(P)H-hydrate dehydratase [Methylotenera sp.]
MFQPALPPRNIDTHKGVLGSMAIIGGDAGMLGAVLLAARAALLSGAGRVYAAMLAISAPTVDLIQPEIMFRSPQELSQLAQLNALVIGPGLGQSNAAMELLEFWLAQAVPMLMDADALNLIAKHAHLATICKKRQAATVITPHAGEAARLLASTIADVQNNRTECALKLAKTLHVTCVLKGVGSICAHHDGAWFINGTGNPGLASGGTGDVLSGIIGGLMAQGLSTLDAAKLGVYVHGAAADALLAQGLGPVGLTASEVALEARNIINQLNASKAV